jgi:hypothetical protein
MNDPAGGRTKWEHLREALTQSWQPGIRVITFSSTPSEIAKPEDLPKPSGGTALALALTAISELRPSSTLVISDGLPDDPVAALSAADKLSGLINVIYCGPDSNAGAQAFMSQLAKRGCGRVVTHRWTGPLALSTSISRLLPYRP